MKLLLAFLLLAASTFAADAPAPKMPAEITLTNGFTLRRVEVVRWEKDRVILKHAGGTTPVTFADISAASRPAVEAMKAEIDRPRKFTGSAFIVTAGAGNYKLGGMEIVVVPIEKSKLRAPTGGFTEKNLPAGGKFVRTDSEGKFEFFWDGGPNFTLYAVATRIVGRSTERYAWLLERMELGEPDAVQLSNHNHL